MKIISKFHDYYDSVLKLGVDTTIVLNRHRTIALQPKKLVEYLGSLGSLSTSARATTHGVNEVDLLYRDEALAINVGFIAFCGYLYPYLVLTAKKDDQATPESHCYYSLPKFIEAIETFATSTTGWRSRAASKLHDELHAFRNGKTYILQHNFTAWDLQRIFDLAGSEVPVEVFQELNTPYFRVVPNDRHWGSRNQEAQPVSLPCGSERVLVQCEKDVTEQAERRASLKRTDRVFPVYMAERLPRLASLQFYKNMPSPFVYTQIEQYLSGVMVSTNDAIDISCDVVKRDAHGFDNHSFKKAKTKKR